MIRRIAALAARWLLPSLALTSAAAHLALAVGSSGAMMLMMVAGAVLCLSCTLHSLTRSHGLRHGAMRMLAMSAASALLHMGLISAHFASGSHDHGSAAPETGSASGHLVWMLALIGFELTLVLLASVVIRVLDDGRATRETGTALPAASQIASGGRDLVLPVRAIAMQDNSQWPPRHVLTSSDIQMQ